MTNKVPDVIQRAANSVDLISFWSPTDPGVGRRLSHFSVASAWTRIGRLFNEDNRNGGLHEFFQFALSLRGRWSRLSKLPNVQLQKTLDNIIQTATSLANQIQASQAELDLALGVLSRQQSIALAEAANSYVNLLKRWCGTDEFLLRPTKPNEESAEATYCVKALTTYLLEQTGQTDSSAIGEIVGALLDLGDRQLTADHVSKLTKQLWLPI